MQAGKGSIGTFLLYQEMSPDAHPGDVDGSSHQADIKYC